MTASYTLIARDTVLRRDGDDLKHIPLDRANGHCEEMLQDTMVSISVGQIVDGVGEKATTRAVDSSLLRKLRAEIAAEKAAAKAKAEAAAAK